MSDTWYYRLGGQEFGPVDAEKLCDLLKQGEIGARTPVRSKSASEWTAIGTLDRFSEPAAYVDTTLAKVAVHEEGYASMWRRGTAFAVDVLAILVFGFLLGNMLGIVLIARQVSAESPDISGEIRLVRIGFLVFPWVYFTLFEGSPFAATPGKLLMRIEVATMDGYRPGFVRAAVRSAAKYISWYGFLLGFAIAPFTKRNQALHDFVARTVVVNA